jgi:hypothetical protein
MGPVKVPFRHQCRDKRVKTRKYRKKTLEIEPGGVMDHVACSG